MDFIDLIENNTCLKTYFIEFPKKLKQLALEGKIIKFHQKGIEIHDLEQLSEYLASDASIFSIKTIMDFFETLNVLQFSKSTSTKHKNSYFFVHPKFGKDKPISDDFYKHVIDRSSKVLKCTKRMSPIHHIELFDRLIRMNNRQKIKITRLEFTRLKLQFVLQRKIDLRNYEEAVIDHSIKDPEYMKNNEIAGYYGDVEIDTLKRVFRNYFPIYQDDQKETTMEVEPASNPQVEPMHATQVEPASVPQIEPASVHQVVDQPVDDDNTAPKEPEKIQEIIVDVCTIPEVKKTVQKKQLKVDDDENKENQPPSKKRRKGRSRSGKVTIKETKEALTFLQQEYVVMSIDDD